MGRFKLTSRQQEIAVLVVAIVIIVILVGVLVVPQVIRLGALGTEEQTAITQLNTAKATYNQLAELKKSSRKSESDLLRVDRKAPEDAELPALLIQIEDISQKAGISFMSIKPAEPVQMDNYQEIPLEITISGYFFSLLDFVYRLEKIPRVINVTGIDIKEGTLGLPNIEVKLNALTFITTPGVKGEGSGGVPAPTGATGTTSTGGTTQ
jgi:type IV pilus assembly protein PilO